MGQIFFAVSSSQLLHRPDGESRCRARGLIMRSRLVRNRVASLRKKAVPHVTIGGMAAPLGIGRRRLGEEGVANAF